MKDSIAMKVAVSFARQYYGAVAEQPERLVHFYAPSASVRHLTQPALKGADAALQKLLSNVSFGPLVVRHVDVKHIGVAGTVSGNIAVTVEGTLNGDKTPVGAGQPFKQEVELREMGERAYLIVSDTLSFGGAPAATAPAVPWALETPPMFTQQPSAEEEQSMVEIQQPATNVVEPVAAEKPATVEAEEKKEKDEKKEPAAAEAAAEVGAAAESPKAPQSFAEALKTKKAATAGSPVKATAPVRVSDKPAVVEKKPKAAAAGGAAKKSASGAAAPAAAPAVVYYDVIIKGLPQSTTEADVRALLPAAVPVSLVKVESKPSRVDPKDMRTFAFVQVDGAVLKEKGVAKKEAVAQVVAEGNAKDATKKITFEEVHERKKPTSAGGKTAAAARATPRPATATPGARPAAAKKA